MVAGIDEAGGAGEESLSEDAGDARVYRPDGWQRVDEDFRQGLRVADCDLRLGGGDNGSALGGDQARTALRRKASRTSDFRRQRARTRACVEQEQVRTLSIRARVNQEITIDVDELFVSGERGSRQQKRGENRACHGRSVSGEADAGRDGGMMVVPNK